MERAVHQPELLDGPLDARLLAGNLRDLVRANRLLDGAELSWRALLAATRRGQGQPTTLSLLDVGTGAADIPRHLLRRAAASALRLVITATDVRSEIVDMAHSKVSEEADLGIEQADGERLPYRERSFDVVHCSLVLHHLEPAHVGAALADMARVARRAVIVNDLDRRRRWWLAAWLLSRLATGNRYTRHDAPLSVRRAYRPNEVSALAAQVGLREVTRLWARPAYRYAIVFVPA